MVDRCYQSITHEEMVKYQIQSSIFRLELIFPCIENIKQPHVEPPKNSVYDLYEFIGTGEEYAYELLAEGINTLKALLPPDILQYLNFIEQNCTIYRMVKCDNSSAGDAICYREVNSNKYPMNYIALSDHDWPSYDIENHKSVIAHNHNLASVIHELLHLVFDSMLTECMPAKLTYVASAISEGINWAIESHLSGANGWNARRLEWNFRFSKTERRRPIQERDFRSIYQVGMYFMKILASTGMRVQDLGKLVKILIIYYPRNIFVDNQTPTGIIKQAVPYNSNVFYPDKEDYSTAIQIALDIKDRCLTGEFSEW